MAALTVHRAFLNDILSRQSSRRALIDPTHTFRSQPTANHHVPILEETAQPSKANVVNYVPGEETIRNDYAARYGASGEFGSNHILGAGDHEICEEYPALRRLMDLKSQLVTSQSHPPLYLPLPSPSPTDILSSLTPHRFDVILITPQSSWDETSSLPIRQLSSDPGFVFLWVGRADSDGLERGRECFAKWGFRRAEDIVWVKTNTGGESGRGASGEGLFASQKEHCLMGIRGTVRRSTDTRFVHCNVDTDVMIWEDSDETDAPRFPPYLYTLIENFCLGTRRLELFGSPTHSRRGWVAAGLPPLPLNLSSVEAFDSITYPSLLPEKSEGRDVLPFHHEVDMLRPKSPQRRGRPGQSIPLPVRPSPVPRPPMNQQMTFAGPSGMGMGMGNGMQPGFGYVQHQMIPQQMVMGYGGPFMNPAMGMGMGMGFNPQMAYMMQGINGGQPGNVNASGGMWMGQPGMGYGGIGEMGTEQQGYGAMMGQQGYGGMGIDQMGQGYGGMGGFDQMGQQQQGYAGMEYMGQGYGGMGGQEQNGTGWQGQWYQQ